MQLLLETVRAFPIRLVQHENVANLHKPGFHALDIIAKPRDHQNQNAISEPHDVDFVLADANRLDQDLLLPCGVQQKRDFRRRTC